MKAKSTCPDLDYSDVKKRGQQRSIRIDGSKQENLLSKSKMFRVETFIPVLDSLIPHLTKRAEAYSSIENLFSFFSQVKTIDSFEPNKKCEKLTSMYHIDFDYGDLLNECKHLKPYIILDNK